MYRPVSVAAGLCMGLLVMASVGTAALAGDLTVTSGEFEDGGVLAKEQEFAGFGCDGQNVSPSLDWSGAPAETKSFAVMVYDPDAPTGSGWWHWVVVNLPPSTTSLPKGAGAAGGSMLPNGALQVRTDFGGPGYGGPCPPEGHGPHHYVFTVHALDLDKLDVTADSSAALVGYFLNYHTLAKGSITGLFER